MEKPIIESQEKFVPKKINKIKKILFLLGILIVINSFVFGVFYFSIYKNKQGSSAGLSLKKKPNVETSPAPFPFQEMTIPYLRNRNYNSSFGKLNQASETATYVGYLTNYDSDGFKVNGYLTIPKGDKPVAGWPAIIFVHGYIPPQNYRTLENYSTYVDYLARNGFIVSKIDLRGHGASEGEPGGGYYSSDYIIDVLNARSALQNSDFVNPEKIGLWGHSMAGNVVSRALGVRPEIPAVAIFAGAVYTYEDFGEFRIQDSSYQPPGEDSPSRRKRNELFERYGQFDPNSNFWKQVPMTNYLSDIKGAIQINHTLDDNVVDIRYSRNFNSLLDNTSIPHELNEYASGGHNFTGAVFDQAMQKTVEFFNQYLK